LPAFASVIEGRDGFEVPIVDSEKPRFRRTNEHPGTGVGDAGAGNALQSCYVTPAFGAAMPDLVVVQDRPQLRAGGRDVGHRATGIRNTPLPTRKVEVVESIPGSNQDSRH
jgi:hypothetical protein